MNQTTDAESSHAPDAIKIRGARVHTPPFMTSPVRRSAKAPEDWRSLPQPRDWRPFGRLPTARSVLDCGSLLPL